MCSSDLFNNLPGLYFFPAGEACVIRILLTVSAVGIVLGCVFFAGFFSLVWLSVDGLILFGLLSAFTIVLFNLLYNYAEKLIEKNKNKYK